MRVIAFPLDKTAATSGWLDNACSTSLSEMTASFAVKPSRLTIFSSCLTFPGQVYVCINFIADGSKFLDMPVSLSTFSRKKLANNGMSSNRSRSGGTVIGRPQTIKEIPSDFLIIYSLSHISDQSGQKTWGVFTR